MSSAGFTFRLERVRALRERFEDLSREELAQALSHRLAVESELHCALERVDQARATQLGTVSGGASGADLVAAQAYAERMGRSRDLCTERLRERDEEVAARREALVGRARDRQSLERLKDRQRAEFALEAQRAENAAMDEIAMARFARAS